MKFNNEHLKIDNYLYCALVKLIDRFITHGSYLK